MLLFFFCSGSKLTLAGEFLFQWQTLLSLKRDNYQDVDNPFLIAANITFVEKVLFKATLLKLWNTLALLWNALVCFALKISSHSQKEPHWKKIFHTKNVIGVDDAVLRLCCSASFFISIILTRTHDFNKSPGGRVTWKVENLTNPLYGGSHQVKTLLPFTLSDWEKSGLVQDREFLQNLASKVKWKPRYSPEQGNIKKHKYKSTCKSQK